MSISKSSSEQISKVLAEFKDLKITVKSLESMLALQTEVLNHIHSKVADLSCKIDMDISGTNLTKTNKITSPVAPVAKINIVTYVKKKYRENSDFFSTIVPQDEIDEVLKDNQIEISKKKGEEAQDNFKANLIYKHCIKEKKDRDKQLRDIKQQEEKSAKEETVVESDVEPEVEEAE